MRWLNRLSAIERHFDDPTDAVLRGAGRDCGHANFHDEVAKVHPDDRAAKAPVLDGRSDFKMPLDQFGGKVVSVHWWRFSSIAYVLELYAMVRATSIAEA